MATIWHTLIWQRGNSLRSTHPSIDKTWGGRTTRQCSAEFALDVSGRWSCFNLCRANWNSYQDLPTDLIEAPLTTGVWRLGAWLTKTEVEHWLPKRTGEEEWVYWMTSSFPLHASLCAIIDDNSQSHPHSHHALPPPLKYCIRKWVNHKWLI